MVMKINHYGNHANVLATNVSVEIASDSPFCLKKNKFFFCHRNSNWKLTYELNMVI